MQVLEDNWFEQLVLGLAKEMNLDWSRYVAAAQTGYRQLVCTNSCYLAFVFELRYLFLLLAMPLHSIAYIPQREEIILPT